MRFFMTEYLPLSIQKDLEGDSFYSASEGLYKHMYVARSWRQTSV